MSQGDDNTQTTGAAGGERDEQGRRIWTDAELADRAVWIANKADIIKAQREGRIRQG